MRHVLHYEQMNMDYIHMRYHHQAKNHKPNTEIKEMTGCFTEFQYHEKFSVYFRFSFRIENMTDYESSFSPIQ